MPKKRYTPLKTFILGVFNTIPRPMSGYELISIAKEWRYDHYIQATNASFYYALKKLEDNGFIKEAGSRQEGNRPEQKIYKLLNKGKLEFQEQVTHFFNNTQELYFNMDALTPFIILFGMIKGKKFILDSIDKQIKERKKNIKFADEGEQYVKSHFLYDLSPFYILPLKHWRFHNDAEIKWLEFFREMVEKIDDFKEQYDKIVKRAISKI
ncbi:MAG: PadR family transcriptional regulator [Candidatus Lokiarchaeia archaeon]|nr:PadR family transcriptional regulator [Candidatus Lokiarchaeia archaeon]